MTHMCAVRWRPLLLGLFLGLVVAIVSVSGAGAQGVAERVKQCAVCHGEDGNSQMANLPSLAGQPEFFIINQLFLMREGVRKVDAMAALVKDLKDDDLQALAKHYAAQPPKASGEPIDPTLVQRGSELAAAATRLRECCRTRPIPCRSGGSGTAGSQPIASARPPNAGCRRSGSCRPWRPTRPRRQ